MPEPLTLRAPIQALVTGGASGMGRAIAERLAQDGCAVLLVDRDATLVEHEAATLRDRGLNVETRVLELTDEQAARALIDALDPLDVLVNMSASLTSGRSMR